MARTRVDIAILCAKSEELMCVQKVLRDQFIKIVDNENPIDQLFDVPGAERNIRLLVRTCGSMGHLSAAIHTSRLISQFQPKIIFFVGTAASLDPNQLQLADVIIPRKAVHRVYDKISEKGQKDYERRCVDDKFEERFYGANILCVQTDTREVSAEIQGLLTGVNYDQISLERGKADQIELNGENYPFRTPKIHYDEDIFSYGMVVDSISYREFIQRHADLSNRKISAIDMESYGFYTAIDLAKTSGLGTDCEGIMIRGISDYAGRKQQNEGRPDDWKQKSVVNAALVTAKIIADTYLKVN